MRSGLPVRWWLTLWYVALLGFALAVFSAGFYFGMRHLLYDELDSTVRNRADIIQNAIELRDGELTLPISDEGFDDQFARLWGPDRVLIAGVGEEFEAAPMNDTGVDAALDGGEDLRWLDADDDRFRVLAEPVVRNGELVGVLEIGIEAGVEDTLGLVSRLVLVSVPLVLGVAAAGGYWLSGRALDPIDRITRLAGNIGERDLRRRITLDLPDDELGRLAATFNAMLDRIEEAFTRQRQFTADAAHELRTPLALLQSRIELALSRPETPDDERARLEWLAADADRLTRLASGLLSLARSDVQGIEIEAEPVDLRELLELVAEQYRLLAASRNIAVNVEAEAEITVMADNDRLIQVLVNLLDNALRHTPDNGRITLGCRQEGGMIHIRVADEGPGIEPKHIPRLFDRFYRVDSARDRDHGGAGLGLSISQSIIEAHGGTITIESTSGRGTIVDISLPAGDSDPTCR